MNSSKKYFYNWKFSEKRPFRQKRDFFDEKKTYFWQYFEKSLLTDQVMEKKTDLWTLMHSGKNIAILPQSTTSGLLGHNQHSYLIKGLAFVV